MEKFLGSTVFRHRSARQCRWVVSRAITLARPPNGVVYLMLEGSATVKEVTSMACNRPAQGAISASAF